MQIIPPTNYQPRTGGYDVENMDFTFKAVEQRVSGANGLYILSQVEEVEKTMKQYREYAMDHQSPPRNTQQLENIFWHNPCAVSKTAMLYGAGIDATLFNDENQAWNLSKLKTTLNDIDYTIDGVTSPFLYIGSWGTAFAMHTEDMNLYSVSYLHYGAPKIWYVVPPKYNASVKKLVKKEYKWCGTLNCPGYMQHKIFLPSPDILRQYNIPFNTVTHKQGQFLITWPGAYHQGFNCNFNIAEAVNFATKKWIPFGRTAQPCTCRYNNIFINAYYSILYDVDCFPDEVKSSLTCQYLIVRTKLAM